ncbi:hypothetical protein [Methylobacterium sp. CM6257]
MGIKFLARPQGLWVITDEDFDHKDCPHKRPEIRPHESDDAKIFDEDPLKAYIIREWRHIDAQSPHEYADLLEFHCLTIVFRSGWRVRVIALYTDASVHVPSDLAYFEAEDLIAKRDPRIGPFWNLPKAEILPEVRLMGLPPKVALQRQKARLSRLMAAEAKAVTGYPAAL